MLRREQRSSFHLFRSESAEPEFFQGGVDRKYCGLALKIHPAAYQICNNNWKENSPARVSQKKIVDIDHTSRLHVFADRKTLDNSPKRIFNRSLVLLKSR